MKESAAKGASDLQKPDSKKPLEEDKDVVFDPRTGKIQIRLNKTQSKGLGKRTVEDFERDRKESSQRGEPLTLGQKVLKRIKLKARKSDNVHFVQESGATFLNASTQSDMKLVNKPTPYAFVQFNPIVF